MQSPDAGSGISLFERVTYALVGACVGGVSGMALWMIIPQSTTNWILVGGVTGFTLGALLGRRGVQALWELLRHVAVDRNAPAARIVELRVVPMRVFHCEHARPNKGHTSR